MPSADNTCRYKIEREHQTTLDPSRLQSGLSGLWRLYKIISKFRVGQIGILGSNNVDLVTMKLIIAGASGFVGTELVRRSISISAFISVIALARRTVPSPKRLYSGSDVSKLRSVVVKDYDEYSPEVLKELANADACIWTGQWILGS